MRSNKKKTHEILEKVERLIEEPPKEAPEPAPAPEPPPEPKKHTSVRERALITYIALLFTIAFILVLLSFLSQRRDISKLSKNADSALSRAELLQDENRELTEEKQRLQQQLQEAHAQQETLRQSAEAMQTDLDAAKEEKENLEQQAAEADQREKQRVRAYELLLLSQRALDEEKTEDFQKNMTELAALADFLDAQGKALYQELLAATAVPTEE